MCSFFRNSFYSLGIETVYIYEMYFWVFLNKTSHKQNITIHNSTRFKAQILQYLVPQYLI